jgi:hypothetical protein
VTWIASTAGFGSAGAGCSARTAARRRSRRDVIVHEGTDTVLRTLKPRDAAGDDFVFQTPGGAPIDEANFQRREWLSALHALGIQTRPFYCRRTYISMLLAAGAKPLFVCRQTGTSLEMIEKHYGDARVDAQQLQMIGRTTTTTWNPRGTLELDSDDAPPSKAKEPAIFYGLPLRAGDRGRTGDVQLGKLAFYH